MQPETLKNDQLFHFFINAMKNIPTHARRYPITLLYKAKGRLDYAKESGSRSIKHYGKEPERTCNVPFLCRSAKKLAEIDEFLNFELTKSTEVLTFLDLCGAPGSFTEYIYWKRGTLKRTQGTFITLSVDAHAKVTKELHKSQLIPHLVDYVHDYTKFNGDITSTKLKNDLISNHAKCDLIIYDGGIDFGGREDQQEELMHELIHCAVEISFPLIKNHGTIVFKVFDLFSPKSIWLCFICFMVCKNFQILKPQSSRNANSERYLCLQDVDDEKCNTLSSHFQKGDLGFNSNVLDAIIETFPNEWTQLHEMILQFAEKQCDALSNITHYSKHAKLEPLYFEQKMDDFRYRIMPLKNIPIASNFLEYHITDPIAYFRIIYNDLENEKSWSDTLQYGSSNWVSQQLNSLGSESIGSIILNMFVKGTVTLYASHIDDSISILYIQYTNNENTICFALCDGTCTCKKSLCFTQRYRSQDFVDERMKLAQWNPANCSSNVNNRKLFAIDTTILIQ